MSAKQIFCLLIHDSDRKDRIGNAIQVSLGEDESIATLKEKVKEKKIDELNDVVAADHLRVWRLCRPQASRKITPDFLASIRLLEDDTGEHDAAYELFPEERIGNEWPNGVVHVLVQRPKIEKPVELSEARTDKGSDSRQTDTLSPLPERQAYNNIRTNRGHTPSEGAKNPKYAESQMDPVQAIWDGRNAPEGPTRIGPPIHIYHPIYPEFTCSVNDPDEKPSTDDLLNAQRLMETVSLLHRHESDYKNKIMEPLQLVLKVELSSGGDYTGSKSRVDFMGTKRTKAEAGSNAGGAKADTGQNKSKGGRKSKGKKCNCAHEIPIVCGEVKTGPGEGGSDATTQVGITYRWICTADARKEICDKCCCPTFLIGASGPYFCILGGVFTDKIIVQRLTDYMWAGLGSTEEEWHVVKVAKVFTALQKCLHKLEDYYAKVAAEPISPSDEPVLHPRFFPYPKHYEVESKTVEFQYIRALEPNEPTCVTFRARRLDNDEDIVVKFVSRYGRRVHEYLAGKQYAPKLHYIGRLPDCGETRTIPQDGDRDISSNDEGLMWMVVMEYVESKPTAPRNAQQQLRTILEDLHGAGYVFGDLRRPNVLVDKNDKVVLIDFNWAGKYDDKRKTRSSKSSNSNQTPGNKQSYVKYPLAISQVEGMWAEGVSGGAYIRPEHDMEMLSRFEF